jgi:hypothetical protein
LELEAKVAVCSACSYPDGKFPRLEKIEIPIPTTGASEESIGFGAKMRQVAARILSGA